MLERGIAERLIDAIEKGDVEGVATLYASDGIQRHPLADGPIEGREAIKASEAALLQAFADVSIDRRATISAGSTVVVELVLSATNTGTLDVGNGEPLPATGQRISVPSVWVLDINDDGLIAEERAYFDSAVLLRQLGLAD